jgi:hypothetical protein
VRSGLPVSPKDSSAEGCVFSNYVLPVSHDTGLPKLPPAGVSGIQDLTNAKGAAIPWFVQSVKAGDVRELAYMIVRQPDDCDDSHVFANAKSYKSRSRIEKDCKILAEIVNARQAKN